MAYRKILPILVLGLIPHAIGQHGTFLSVLTPLVDYRPRTSLRSLKKVAIIIIIMNEESA